MEENTIKNPWLGLQSYREGEILYGRDEDIRDLTQSVLNDTDTLLYGKSGIGKSSILNAGVIPAMKRNDFIPIMVRLSHKESHSYLKQVKYAIEETLLPIPHNEDGTPIELTEDKKRIRKEQLSKQIVEKVPCHNAAKESFYEYFHRHEFYDNEKNRVKLLVIFDQFEEIFTLQEEDKTRRNFFSEIADLLNDVLPAYLQKETTSETTKQNVIDLSNESNFDSLFSSLEFEKEEDIQEYVADNEIHFIFTIREDFLSDFEYYTASIPSLKHNRYGLRPINEEQAAQIIQKPIPNLVDKDVTELIIQKVTGRTDFSLDGIPEIDVDSAVLSLYLNRLYEASNGQPFTSKLVEEKGGEIISSFYIDSIKDISEESIEYLEDMLLNGNGRRDNITIFDAKYEGGLTDEEIRLLCDERKVLRQFNYAGELRIEFVHDILCPIVKEHKEQREQARFLEKERIKQEREKQAALEARQQAIRSRNKILWSFLGISAIVVLSSFLYWYGYVKPYHEDCDDFIVNNGWPIKKGQELDNGEKDRTFYYRLIREGAFSKRWIFWGKERNFNEVVIINKSEKMSISNLYNPLVSVDDLYDDDENTRKFALLMSKVKQIKFEASSNNDDVVGVQVFLDCNNQPLFCYTFFNQKEDSLGVSKNEIWCTFTSADGKPLKIRGAADRMMLKRDSSGYDSQYLFYDASGAPCTNQYDWCYGIQINEYRDSIDYLDEFGNICLSQYIEKTDKKAINHYHPRTISWDYNKKVETFDANYNIDSVKFYFNNKLVSSETHPAIIIKKYDGYGRITEFHSYYADMNKYSSSNYYSSMFFDYSGNTSEPKKQTFKDVINGKEKTVFNKVKFKEKIITQKYNYDVNDLITETIELDKNGIEIGCSYKVENAPIVHPDYGYQQYTTKVGDGIHRGKKIKIFTTTYKDINETIHPYAIKEEWKDCNGNIILYRTWDKHDNIITSMGYEYRNGVLNMQYVVGVEGLPIRCPFWEMDGLSYYKLQLVRDFNWNISRLQSLDEFGANSITYAGLLGENVGIRTQNRKEKGIDKIGEWKSVEESRFLVIPEVDKLNCKAVNYVHLLKENKSGINLHDGDIIQNFPISFDRTIINDLSLIKKMRIIRCVKGTWTIVDNLFHNNIDIDKLKCEYYPVFLTNDEYEKLPK